jgi:lysophospholipase L1-like esterase
MKEVDMKSAVRPLLATVMLVAALAGTASASPAVGRTYYISVGDSAAAGFEPIGRFSHGYANQLYRAAREESPGLRLIKLGCPGETTDTMIKGGICPYREGSQLMEAVAFLQAHPGQIEFITIDIGANDWLDACFDGILIDVGCTEEILPRLAARLQIILGRLQAAAPGVPIVGMTYWDPFLGFWVLSPLHGEDIARQDEAAAEVLNAGLVDVYLSSGAAVADVAGPDFFDTANFSDMVWTERWGEIPVNVAKACAWTWFCSVDYTLDVHPNTTGYGVIAKAFEEVLDL